MHVVINAKANDVPFSGISHYICGFVSCMDMPHTLMKPEANVWDRFPYMGGLKRRAWWEKQLNGKASVYHLPHNIGYLPNTLPTVVTIHDLIPLDTVTGWRRARYLQHIRRVAKQATMIITASEFAKKDIVNRLGVSGKKIAVIYHGLDQQYHRIPTQSDFGRLQRYGIGEEFYLTNGRDRRKNAKVVIEAFIELKETHGLPGKLVVLGNQLRRKKYPEHPDVLFTGFVEEEDMALLYCFAKQFYFLSSFEGFGLPIIEALAMKTPTIVSDQSCLPEIAGDYAQVISLDRNQVKEKMLEWNGMVSSEKIDQAREYALSFSWERSAKEHQRIYEMAGMNL